MDFGAVWRRVFGKETESAPQAAGQAQLAAFLQVECRDARLYAALAARTCGEPRQSLLALSREEACHRRLLEAEYFLCSGACYIQPPAECAPPAPLLETLRRQYHGELAGAKEYDRAAALCLDTRLARLLRRLAADERCHACRVLSLLKQAM